MVADPVTVVIVLLLAVIVLAVVTGRLDVVGAVIAAAFVLIIWALFGAGRHP